MLLLPSIQVLRRNYPDWRLTMVVSPEAVELFAPTLAPDEIIPVRRAELQRSWRKPWRLLRWLRLVRRLRPDGVFLSFDQTSVARALAAMSGARVTVDTTEPPTRWRGRATHRVPLQPGQNFAEWEWTMMGTLVRALGREWPVQFPQPPRPELPVKPFAPPAQRRRVVVHFGASREFQRWPGDRCSDLAQQLAQRYEVLWVERADIPAQPPPAVRRIAVNSVAQFNGIVASADLFVGFQSAPMHLAAALGCPAVILAGPSLTCWDPPWHAERIRILRAPNVSCLPCDRMPVSPNRCTNLATPMACLRYWSVDAVARICDEWIERFAAERRRESVPH